ncbi:HVA22-like protein c [Sesamum alatum]|uniref:HVA22-like protein c n=1 Tax=Sesamum alatum TaxID=300844 RepID=A0AAE2CXA9_9LAMI|nr:HVA22-like protein c [Sesamum alatum]
MGIMGLLKFALMCIDFLAWPVIALGYPLFSTIRAIETSSQYHLKKLAKYWTLFALISLLEFALVKIIEWIPFWSSLKLIATVWLVVPRFRGACHAYRRLITLCLFADVHSVIDRWSVGFQAVIDRFYKPEEEKLLKTESFGDVVEKYIKENGAEALEKLIASKIQLESKEHDHSQRNTAVPEPEEKNAAAMLEQLKEPDAVQKDHETLVATEKTASTEARPMKEPDAVQKDNEMLEATEKTASAEAKPVQNAEPSTNGWTPKQTEAASEVKETKNVQQEWTCALCQVTATSEKMLKDHLRGRKHKSKIESLKKSKLDEESTASSPSAAGKSSAESVKGKGKAKEGSQQQSWKKTEEKVQSQVPSDQQNQRKPKQNGAANQQFKLWCTVCHVKLLSDVDLAAHLRGKRHTSNVQNL